MMSAKNQNSQSWTSYFLSGYSSSVTPLQDPDLYAPDAMPVSSVNKRLSDSGNRKTMITTTSESSSPPPTSISPSPLNDSTSSSSPWGPYIKTGRGGAGNFAWQSETPAATSDSASVRPSSTSAAPSKSLATASDEEAGQKPQAGLSLAQQQKDAAEMEERERADILAARARGGDREGYKHTGRGGAGNWTATDTDPAAAGISETDIEASKDTDTMISTSEVKLTDSASTKASKPSSNLSNPSQPKQSSNTTTNPTQPRGFYGRGGAGNHAAALETIIQTNKAAEAEAEERRRRRRIGDEELDDDVGGRGGGGGGGGGGLGQQGPGGAWGRKVVESVELTVRQPAGVVIRQRRAE